MIKRVDKKDFGEGIKTGLKSGSNSLSAVLNNVHIEDEQGLPALRVFFGNLNNPNNINGAFWVVDADLKIHFVEQNEKGEYIFYDAPSGYHTIPVLPVRPYTPEELKIGRSYEVDQDSNGWVFKSYDFAIYQVGILSDKWIIDTSNLLTPFITIEEVISYGGISLKHQDGIKITYDKNNKQILIELFGETTGEVWLKLFH